jgi:hypothetical protein
MNTTRLTAEIDDSFVVFLIGMRINRLWKVHRWLPVAIAMPRMLRELSSRPDFGLLNHETFVSGRMVVMVQYWDSFESLRTYARDGDHEHVSAWVDYNRSSGRTGDVGIFHETYLVDADDCENVYNNVPEFGLGAAGTLVPARGSLETAAKRLGTEEDGPAVRTDGSRTDSVSSSDSGRANSPR